MKSCVTCDFSISANDKLYCGYYPPKRVSPSESACPAVPPFWRCSFHSPKAAVEKPATEQAAVAMAAIGDFNAPVPGAKPVPGSRRTNEPEVQIPETGKKVKSYAD